MNNDELLLLPCVRTNQVAQTPQELLLTPPGDFVFNQLHAGFHQKIDFRIMILMNYYNLVISETDRFTNYAETKYVSLRVRYLGVLQRYARAV